MKSVLAMIAIVVLCMLVAGEASADHGRLFGRFDGHRVQRVKEGAGKAVRAVGRGASRGVKCAGRAIGCIAR